MHNYFNKYYMKMFHHKSDWIYEGLVFNPQCCCLCICIFVGRGSCVGSTTLLLLYICWENVTLDTWRSCVPSTLLSLERADTGSMFDPQCCCISIFVGKASHWIYDSHLFHSVYLCWESVRLRRSCVQSTLNAPSTS